MNLLNKLMGSGVKEAAEGITTLASGIRTAITGKLPPAEQAALDAKLRELENHAMQMQTTINLADAQSNDKFQSRWRPFIGWVCGLGLAIQYLVFPIANMAYVVPKYDFSELINLIIALLGLATLRSYEKGKGVQ